MLKLKRICLFCAAAVLLLGIASGAEYGGTPPTVWFRGRAVDFGGSPPFISGDAYLMAACAELAGLMELETIYVPDTRTFFCFQPKTGKAIAFVAGSAVCGEADEIRGPFRESVMPAAPEVISGSFYVPVRYFCAFFDYEVRWDGEKASANILPRAQTFDISDLPFSPSAAL